MQTNFSLVQLADPHMREHAQELVEILERGQVPASRPTAPPISIGGTMTTVRSRMEEAIRLRMEVSHYAGVV